MSCSYCYVERRTEHKILDWNFAKRVLNDYVSNGGIDSIRFFAAGEPTTEMKLLKKIYHEAKGLNSEIKTEIQTNGMFDKNTAEWLGRNMDHIYVSVDLLPEDHDKYRLTADGKASSPLILDNLSYLRDMPGRKAKVGIRATISERNIRRQKEAIDLYSGNYGIDLFWVDPIFLPVSNIDKRTCGSVNMMDFAVAFVDAHKHAWERGVFYESNLTMNFDRETDKACHACLPMPNLTMDGYLSACEMATHGKDAGKMDPMIYAHYDHENDMIIYDREKMKRLTCRVLSAMPVCCHTCVAGKHCAGFCLGEVLNESGNLFGVKASVCDAVRHIYTEIGHLYHERFGDAGFPHEHP